MPWECTEAEKDAARLIFEAYSKKNEAENGKHENDIHLTLTGYRLRNPVFTTEDDGHESDKVGGVVGADVK